MKRITDYETASYTAVDTALSARVDSFLKETVLPQVEEALRSPKVAEKITKRVNALLNENLEETGPYSYRSSGVENLVDDHLDSLVEHAVHAELGKYIRIERCGKRTTEIRIEEKLQQLAKEKVAARLKTLPAQLNALIEEFMKDVQNARITADSKRELKSTLWGVLVRVVANRFRTLLGAPTRDDEED